MIGELTKRQAINVLVSDLKRMRTSYEPQWREVGDLLLPYRANFQLSDQARGDRRNNRIYDSTATSAVRTLKAGFMAGMTSPAKQWCRLTTGADPDLSEFGPVKEWLDYVNADLLSVLDRSNAYKSLPILYGDMGGFGTGCMSVEEDYENVIHTRVFPIGSYWIGQDEMGRVNTFYREFRYTIRQLLRRFGQDADYSTFVRNLFRGERWEEWIDVGHLIAPNDDYEHGAPRKKRWKSCWFELGSSSTGSSAGYSVASVAKEDRYLQESGFDSFPILCGRWETKEGDVYGIDCPGMMAIGDIKGLQLGEKRSWQAIEKLVNPHWVGPSQLRGKDHGFIPGEITYIDEREGQQGLRPLYEINPRIQELEAKQEQVRGRIYEAFYYNRFRLLEQLEDRTRTATEIQTRQAEALTELIPTVTSVTDGVLRPLIDRVFEIMVKQGRVPPAPPELQGKELDVEYLGTLAQAQKAVHVAPIERLLAVFTPLAELRPEILDKMDLDQMVDEEGTALGVPAKTIRSDEMVAQMRAERAEQARQAQALETIKQGAGAVKQLAASPTEGKNALTDLMEGGGQAA